jgi:hypothetical protein
MQAQLSFQEADGRELPPWVKRTQDAVGLAVELLALMPDI